MNIDNVVIELKEHEGYRGEVYKDTLGFDTVGYGCKMPITRAEATFLLRHRLMAKEEELKRLEPRYMKANGEVKAILLNMAYQIGVKGLLGFRNMLKSIENHEYVEASIHGLDSKWHKQTQNRANDLMDRLARVKDITTQAQQ